MRAARTVVATLVVSVMGWLAGTTIPARAAGQVTEQSDVLFASPAGQALHMDIFLPPGNGPFPAVLVLHGGAWYGTTQTGYDPAAQALAEEGFAAFSADYRKAPRFTYPAAVDDAHTAVEWIRSHAAQYHVDPGRIGALGGSSGGHLADMLATQTTDPTSGSGVKASVSWSGPTNLNDLIQQGEAEGQAVAQNLQTITTRWLGCDPSQCPDTAAAASPITYVKSSGPPMMLVGSQQDPVPFAQQQEMAGALQKAGVTHQLVQVPGSGHAIAYMNTTVPSQGESVVQASSAFLHTYLGGAPSGSSPSPGGKRPSGGGRAPTTPPQALPSIADSSGPSSGLILLAFAAGLLGIVAIGVALGLARRPRVRGPSARR